VFSQPYKQGVPEKSAANKKQEKSSEKVVKKMRISSLCVVEFVVHFFVNEMQVFALQ